MLRPRWRKVLRDLWSNKTRTILVVLSIAVGVFAVGLIMGTQTVLTRELDEIYATTNPASLTLFIQPFDDDLVKRVQRMPEVVEAEGRQRVGGRIQTGPDEWVELDLFALPDYDDMRIYKIAPVEGAWPPPKRGILIERAALSLIDAKVGDEILVQIGDDVQRTMPIAGLVHDLRRGGAMLEEDVAGYVTFDTLEWLGEPRTYDRMHIIVNGDTSDESHIEAVGDQLREKVERAGYEVYWVSVRNPNEHEATEALNPIFLLLGTIGSMALILSGFLVVNTISAILAQHTRQIGIMKSIGAAPKQILGMYFSMVFVFGLLSLLVALPLGFLGSRYFTTFLAGLINFDVVNFDLPPTVFGVEVVISLLVPLLAAVVPVISGSRLSVHMAISDQGVGRGIYGRNWLDRVMGRIRGVSRPVLISLRNTFRKKGRLMLTLLTLTLSSAIFIGVFNVRASLLQTLDEAFLYFNYDIEVDLGRAYRAEQVEGLAQQIPGVVAVESWNFNVVYRVDEAGQEGDEIFMIVPPNETQMINPILVEGRWLLPEDENAVVINSEVLKEEPDLNVGDTLRLKLDDRETDWQIVGLVRGVLAGPWIYANQTYYHNLTGGVGKTGRIRVSTDNPDADYAAEKATQLEDHLTGLGIQVDSSETTAVEKRNIENIFNIIISFLSVMAVLLAVVGGLGLTGTMSINVIERMREIGVMRAIGATDRSVRRIVMIEGVLIGILSWFVGAVLAIPLGKALSDVVGEEVFEVSLTYIFSIPGALIWLGVVIILAAAASYLPARSASRLSIREVLAYE